MDALLRIIETTHCMRLLICVVDNVLFLQWSRGGRKFPVHIGPYQIPNIFLKINLHTCFNVLFVPRSVRCMPKYYINFLLLVALTKLRNKKNQQTS